MKKSIVFIIVILLVLSMCLVARADTTNKTNVITSIFEWIDDSNTSALEELLGE